MERFPASLAALLRGLPEPDARWRPDGGAWSITEIVCHLADEEIEDFGTRVCMTLDDPAGDWPPIDPEGAAVERRYNERSLAETLERFAEVRSASIAKLRAIEAPDWERAHEHPRWGPMAAGMLMTSWCAHDALHLRQIAKRLFQLAARDGAGHSTIYAGEWTV